MTICQHGKYCVETLKAHTEPNIVSKNDEYLWFHCYTFIHCLLCIRCYCIYKFHLARVALDFVYMSLCLLVQSYVRFVMQYTIIILVCTHKGEHSAKCFAFNALSLRIKWRDTKKNIWFVFCCYFGNDYETYTFAVFINSLYCRLCHRLPLFTLYLSIIIFFYFLCEDSALVYVWEHLSIRLFTLSKLLWRCHCSCLLISGANITIAFLIFVGFFYLSLQFKQLITFETLEAKCTVQLLNHFIVDLFNLIKSRYFVLISNGIFLSMKQQQQNQ